MAQINLKKLMRWLIDDIKKDISTFKNIINGKARLPRGTFNIGKVLKESWYWYLIIIAAFLCGYFIASMYLQNDCIEYIETEVVPNCEDWQNIYYRKSLTKFEPIILGEFNKSEDGT